MDSTLHSVSSQASSSLHERSRDSRVYIPSGGGGRHNCIDPNCGSQCSTFPLSRRTQTRTSLCLEYRTGKEAKAFAGRFYARRNQTYPGESRGHALADCGFVIWRWIATDGMFAAAREGYRFYVWTINYKGWKGREGSRDDASREIKTTSYA